MEGLLMYESNKISTLISLTIIFFEFLFNIQEFESSRGAKKACEKLDEYKFKGKRLYVKIDDSSSNSRDFADAAAEEWEPCPGVQAR